MKQAKLLVGVLALVALGACAPARPTATATEPASASSPGAHDHAAHRRDSAGPHGGPGMAHDHGNSGAMMEGMCPMKVPGVTVSTSEVEGGVSVVFTTTGDVSDLRARVRRMAEMHEHMGGMHHGGGAAKPGMMRGCMMGKAGGMHAATATVEDVEGGARLILVPKDAADLPALRAHVQQCRDRMEKGECPMMGGRDAEPDPASHPH
jgi:hypothetical protein